MSRYDRLPTEKNFGIVFSIVFLLIALYPVLYGDDIRLWAVVVTFMLIVIAHYRSSLLVFPNKLWFKFGLMLGAVVAPVVMGIVYLVTVVPVGLVMKLMGRDLLNQKIDAEAKSYWLERKLPVGSMKDQF